MIRLLALLVVLLPLSLFADGADAAEADQNQIRARIKAISPKAEVTSIEKTPISDLYQVTLDGADILYVSADGQHFLNGHLYTYKNGGLIDLTEQHLSAGRGNILKSVPEKGMIVYSPKGKVKSLVYAFTDVDCGFCKRFHQEVPALNDLGIEVRYLAWPRSGLGPQSATYQKMQKVWCANDRLSALTDTKLKNKVPTGVEACETAIPEHFKLGFQLGVKGTPALFTEDGRQVGGYRKAKELAEELGVL